MAINRSQRGFALLIAVIFMSVMLTFGLALASLGYKQQVLASSALGSQYAFYAADSALECALFEDQKNDLFNYAAHTADPNTPSNIISCDGSAATQKNYSYSADNLSVSERVSLDDGKHCADITVYKYATGKTYIFSQGYDTICSIIDNPPPLLTARFSSRAMQIAY